MSENDSIVDIDMEKLKMKYDFARFLVVRLLAAFITALVYVLSGKLVLLN